MTYRLFALVVLLLLSGFAVAQESPLFVVYDHYLEEPGNLEVSTEHTIGLQKRGSPHFWAPLVELEYGVTPRWTASLYLEGARQHDTTVFTGFRLENRFAPLKSDHRINPVLYFEFENINEASLIQKEIVGHGDHSDESLAELRQEKAREIETKLILSSRVRNWTIAENFIVEKNLSNPEPFEFGYAFGIYRALSSSSSRVNCRFCRKNLAAGMELYGGLGTTDAFGFSNTAQYLAPGLSWRIGEDSSLKISPSFGLTPTSARMLIRVGYTFEIESVGQKVTQLFGKK